MMMISIMVGMMMVVMMMGVMNDDDGGGDVQDAESLADETADSAKIWVGRARNRGKHRRIQMFIGRCKNQSTLSGAFLQQNKHDARFIEFVKYT